MFSSLIIVFFTHPCLLSLIQSCKTSLIMFSSLIIFSSLIMFSSNVILTESPDILPVYRYITRQSIHVCYVIQSCKTFITNYVYQKPYTDHLENNRLVRIKITVSEESRADVGSSVIGLLHGNGIEFVDAYFSQENMIITFNREDASRAYDVLRSEIG